MPKFTQKYTIAILLENKSVKEFMAPDWPQHITLADVFAVEWKKAMQKIADIAVRQAPFESTITGDASFGRQEKTPVLLIEKTSKIMNLHEQILSALEADGAAFNTPEYIHKDFLPHTTIRNTTNLQVGDTISLDNLALIDMFPNENANKRRIIAYYEFKGKKP